MASKKQPVTFDQYLQSIVSAINKVQLTSGVNYTEVDIDVSVYCIDGETYICNDFTTARDSNLKFKITVRRPQPFDEK